MIVSLSLARFLLFTLAVATFAHAAPNTPDPMRSNHIRRPPASSHPKTVAKRGLAGIPGDIEYMGFFGSLLAIPTMISYLGIQTNYNLQKSYFNSQIQAEYYKQSREMLRAHAAKLIQEQEKKFAKAGQTWPGMVYDAEGNLRQGAKVPMSGGKVVDVPPKPARQGVDAGDAGGVAGSSRTGAGGSGAEVGAGEGDEQGVGTDDIASAGVVDATKSPGLSDGSSGGDALSKSI
ncbi:uncharacterized protein UHOD_02509 [Ustilago sp. UG-2017b]|nr:uncharacterized protein UHOD_02509 [Ustilago sp. UG-2017b]